MSLLGFSVGVLCTILAESAAFGLLKLIKSYLTARERASQELVLAQVRAEQEARDKKNETARQRYADDPQAPLRSKARSVVRSVINDEQRFTSEFGYSISSLLDSLYSKFDPSMSFSNYGSVWEIDHIQPLAAFDLADVLQFRKAIHPSNLQPLFRGENQSKGCKGAICDNLTEQGYSI